MNVHHFRLWPHPAPLISWCVNVCARIPSHLSQRQSEEEEGPRTEDALGHDSPVSVAVTSPGNMQVRRKSSFFCYYRDYKTQGGHGDFFFYKCKKTKNQNQKKTQTRFKLNNSLHLLRFLLV